jgi:hypothetical protein
MERDRLDVRFRLLGGPPRLRTLAFARLTALGLVAGDQGAPAAVTAIIDPHAVVDVPALRAAAARARASGRATRYAALDAMGQPSGTAVVLVPAACDERDAVVASGPLGRWLPRSDAVQFPDGPAAAAIYGIFREATGYAAVGRNLVIGLAAQGTAVAAKTAWWQEAGRAGLSAADDALLNVAAQLDADPRLPSLLLRPAGDASGTPSYSEFAATRLTGPICAVTMFECDDVPGRWVRSLRECDQVWVPSTFNLETFASAGIDPDRLRLVPIGIDAPTLAPDGPTLELPNRRRTAFLSVFDWNERKGPDVLLRAWARAFGPDDDVVLYLRTGASTVGARGGPLAQLRALGLDPAHMAPIEILSEPLPNDAYAALFRSVDAFVLTSRGEAFCLPLLEAMACGIPAIGTGYGGSADFLDATTGFPIPARLVPVARALSGRIPFYAGQRWADPSIDATVAALRRVVDDPGEAERRAAHAFVRAQLTFDRRVTARAAQRAIDEARTHSTVHSAGSTLLTAPIFADSSSGRAARGLFDALESTGATPRVEVVGDRSADLDPVQTRHLRRAVRLLPDADEAGITVDLVGPRTRAVFLTVVPDDVRALAGVETIWSDDRAVLAGLAERGVERRRLHALPLPVDVTLWTPDARGAALSGRTIFVAPEPQRVDALTAFARTVVPGDDVVLVIAPAAGAPISAEALIADLQVAMQRAGVPRWNPQVLAIPAPLGSRESIRALAPTTLAFAADASWADHEYVRACGVPVLAPDQIELARALLADDAVRDAEGLRVRRDAVARSRTYAAAVRTAFDAVASLAPVERTVRPVRIVAVIAPTVPEPARVFAMLRSTALHELVGVDADLRRVDYVVRVGDAVQTARGWDETLINALEARPVAVAESFAWEAVAPNFPEYSFEDMLENALLSRNCEAGTLAPTASGALQLVRAVDATATGPVWRSVACAVQPLFSAVAT